MSIWGHTAEGVAVPIYALKSGQIEVRVMAFGANLVSIKAPDRAGKLADIVLGYDTLEGYLNDIKTYLGAIVGRYGNRIAMEGSLWTEKLTRFRPTTEPTRCTAARWASTGTCGSPRNRRMEWSSPT